MQKYIETMLRSSIRVVLAAENDLVEVAGDPGVEELRLLRGVGVVQSGSRETLDSEPEI